MRLRYVCAVLKMALAQEPRHRYLSDKELQNPFATPELGLLYLCRHYSRSWWVEYLRAYLRRRDTYNNLLLLAIDATILVCLWLY